MNQSLADVGVRSGQVDVDALELARRRGPDDKLNVRSSLAFFAVHLVPSDCPQNLRRSHVFSRSPLDEVKSV